MILTLRVGVLHVRVDLIATEGVPGKSSTLCNFCQSARFTFQIVLYSLVKPKESLPYINSHLKFFSAHPFNFMSVMMNIIHNLQLYLSTTY